MHILKNEIYKSTVKKLVLQLRDPFGIARATWKKRTSFVLSLRWGRWTGLGEAQPSATYGEKESLIPTRIRQAVQSLKGTDPLELERASHKIARSFPGYPSAKAAVETALHDLASRKLGLPLYKLLGIPEPSLGQTSYTVGLDSPERMAEKAEEARKKGFSILKVKLNGKTDREIMAAVTSAHPGPYRLDANESWTPSIARKFMPVIKNLGRRVSLIEQPFPRGRLNWTQDLYRRLKVPLFLDEDILTAADVWRVRGLCSGINIKLMKAGGLREMIRMISVCKNTGLQVMIGCMTESSLAMTAAAQVASLCDLLDLDGHLLLARDPYVGLTCRNGVLTLPKGPGLGVQLRKE